ncbi:MAG: hypothetical protein Q9227_002452 [Pyrenula ochraceoflavens]
MACKDQTNFTSREYVQRWLEDTSIDIPPSRLFQPNYHDSRHSTVASTIPLPDAAYTREDKTARDNCFDAYDSEPSVTDSSQGERSLRAGNSSKHPRPQRGRRELQHDYRETYEKKPRRKTKEDKYVMKPDQTRKRPAREQPHGQHAEGKRRKKSGTTINNQFQAPNVPQDRLSVPLNCVRPERLSVSPSSFTKSSLPQWRSNQEHYCSPLRRRHFSSGTPQSKIGREGSAQICVAMRSKQRVPARPKLPSASDTNPTPLVQERSNSLELRSSKHVSPPGTGWTKADCGRHPKGVSAGDLEEPRGSHGEAEDKFALSSKSLEILAKERLFANIKGIRSGEKGDENEKNKPETSLEELKDLARRSSLLDAEAQYLPEKPARAGCPNNNRGPRQVSVRNAAVPANSCNKSEAYEHDASSCILPIPHYPVSVESQPHKSMPARFISEFHDCLGQSDSVLPTDFRLPTNGVPSIDRDKPSRTDGCFDVAYSHPMSHKISAANTKDIHPEKPVRNKESLLHKSSSLDVWTLENSHLLPNGHDSIRLRALEDDLYPLEIRDFVTDTTMSAQLQSKRTHDLSRSITENIESESLSLLNDPKRGLCRPNTSALRPLHIDPNPCMPSHTTSYLSDHLFPQDFEVPSLSPDPPYDRREKYGGSNAGQHPRLYPRLLPIKQAMDLERSSSLQGFWYPRRLY